MWKRLHFFHETLSKKSKEMTLSLKFVFYLLKLTCSIRLQCHFRACEPVSMMDSLVWRCLKPAVSITHWTPPCGASDVAGLTASYDWPKRRAQRPWEACNGCAKVCFRHVGSHCIITCCCCVQGQLQDKLLTVSSLVCRVWTYHLFRYGNRFNTPGFTRSTVSFSSYPGHFKVN